MRMDQADLNANFGWSFMEDSRWLENYVSWLQYEEFIAWRREAYSIGIYMSQEFHYGLPERQAEFRLSETFEGDPYRMYSVDLFPHEEWDP